MDPLTDTGWLAVGLGNPGEEYAATRHNLGFMLIDVLAARSQTKIGRTECRSRIGRTVIGKSVVELAKPQTFMNLSGEAIKCLVAKPGRSIDRLIVISDDLALPLSTIRLRRNGTHGGQNGLRSIIEQLKTSEFVRLRIGMQPEYPVADAKRFVLENFARGEVNVVAETLERAADAVEMVVSDGIDAAMSRFN